MDAIELLKDDHKKVQELFDEFEDAGDQAYKTKQDLVERITQELEVHSTLEEEIFYPAARDDGEDAEEQVKESIEEHHVVDRLLEELGGMSAEDEQYDAKVQVLIENVKHHIEEEEGELFPMAGKQLDSSEREELGKRMEELRQRLTAR